MTINIIIEKPTTALMTQADVFREYQSAEDIKDRYEAGDIPPADVSGFVDLGANICIRGIQGSCKTSLMVRFTDRLVSRFGYQWDEVTADLHLWEKKPWVRNERGIVRAGTPRPGDQILKAGIPIPGYTYKNTTDIKKYIRKVYRTSGGRISHKIILIDEIDSVYSHLKSYDPEDQADLLTLWQDKKFENFFIYTKHIGPGCNNIIRKATEISMFPYYDRRFDTLYAFVINGFYMRDSVLPFTHFSRIFAHYDRKEPVI